MTDSDDDDVIEQPEENKVCARLLSCFTFFSMFYKEYEMYDLREMKLGNFIRTFASAISE